MGPSHSPHSPMDNPHDRLWTCPLCRQLVPDTHPCPSLGGSHVSLVDDRRPNVVTPPGTPFPAHLPRYQPSQAITPSIQTPSQTPGWFRTLWDTLVGDSPQH